MRNESGQQKEVTKNVIQHLLFRRDSIRARRTRLLLQVADDRVSCVPGDDL